MSNRQAAATKMRNFTAQAWARAMLVGSRLLSIRPRPTPETGKAGPVSAGTWGTIVAMGEMLARQADEGLAQEDRVAGGNQAIRPQRLSSGRDIGVRRYERVIRSTVDAEVLQVVGIHEESRRVRTRIFLQHTFRQCLQAQNGSAAEDERQSDHREHSARNRRKKLARITGSYDRMFLARRIGACVIQTTEGDARSG